MKISILLFIVFLLSFVACSDQSSSTNLTSASTQFVASKESDKYHLLNCEWAQKITATHSIFFSSTTEAAKAGYKPCKVCHPETASPPKAQVKVEESPQYTPPAFSTTSPTTPPAPTQSSQPSTPVPSETPTVQTHLENSATSTAIYSIKKSLSTIEGDDLESVKIDLEVEKLRIDQALASEQDEAVKLLLSNSHKALSTAYFLRSVQAGKINPTDPKQAKNLEIIVSKYNLVSVPEDQRAAKMVAVAQQYYSAARQAVVARSPSPEPVSQPSLPKPPPDQSPTIQINPSLAQPQPQAPSVTLSIPRPEPVAQPSPTHPPGASARCRDGSYSYSANHRGTCSHHGGVAQWF